MNTCKHIHNYVATKFNFCPECGIKLDKEPDPGINKADPWWLVVGRLYECWDYNYVTDRVCYYYNGIWGFVGRFSSVGEGDGMKYDNFRPVGFPFDCITEDTHHISFSENGNYCYIHEGRPIIREKEYPINYCPVAWRGKGFNIDQDLKDLLFKGRR